MNLFLKVIFLFGKWEFAASGNWLAHWLVTRRWNMVNSNLEISRWMMEMALRVGASASKICYWLGSIQLIVKWRNPPSLLDLTFMLIHQIKLGMTTAEQNQSSFLLLMSDLLVGIWSSCLYVLDAEHGGPVLICKMQAECLLLIFRGSYWYFLYAFLNE